MCSARYPTIYFSLDFELDGWDPTRNSILSIGLAAFGENGKRIGTFYCNLLPLPDHQPNPMTMEHFWNKAEHHAAKEALQSNQCDPQKAMADMVKWVQSFTGEKILIAYPLKKIEGPWLDHYLSHFGISDPFDGRRDIEEELAACEGAPELTSKHPYTHNALDDAVCQGEMFMQLMQWKHRHESPGR